MRRAISCLAVLASLLVSNLTTARPEHRFRIERSQPFSTEPLAAEDMKRLAAGEPPRVNSKVWVRTTTERSLFKYKGDDGYCHSPNMHVGFVVNYTVDFSAAAIVKTSDPEGMVVTRDANGAITRAGTQRDWFFVHEKKDVIAIERYFSRDCAADKKGEIKPLPGTVFESRYELRQTASDARNKMRSFEIKIIIPQLDPDPSRRIEMVFSDSKGRSRVVMREYLGKEPASQTLSSEDSLERIIWPEGPGYRQISRIEKHSGDQSLLEEHSVSQWRVEKNGQRKKVAEQDLRQEQEESQADDELQ